MGQADRRTLQGHSALPSQGLGARLKVKGIQRPGRAIHDPGHFIDIMPTIVEGSGAFYPSEYVARKVWIDYDTWDDQPARPRRGDEP